MVMLIKDLIHLKKKKTLTMNREHHIQELEAAIEHIKKEPVKGWLGRVTKSYKIKKIEKKIKSLKKRVGND